MSYFVFRKKLSRSVGVQAKLSYYLPFDALLTLLSFIGSHSSNICFVCLGINLSNVLEQIKKIAKQIFKNYFQISNTQ